MARPIWNGAISFGLVSIPVKLYSATVDRSVRFHQLDADTGSRVRLKRVRETDGVEVPYANIVKGYELASGRHVVITDDELRALDPKASRTIDLLEFVDLESIDPIYYDSAYLLGPDPATAKPYALLLKAMTEAGKVGIATFVMRGKEHLCAIRPDGEKLVLSTMRYADEIRAADEIEELDAVTAAELSDKEVAMAEQLIASLEATFDPDRFEDHYREKVLELVTRKESGEEGVVEAPEPADDDRVIDLMAALRASVEGAKAARRRHPTGDAADADDEAEAEEAAPKARGKKAAAKKAPAKKAAAKKAAKTAAARKSA